VLSLYSSYLVSSLLMAKVIASLALSDESRYLAALAAFSRLVES